MPSSSALGACGVALQFAENHNPVFYKWQLLFSLRCVWFEEENVDVALFFFLSSIERVKIYIYNFESEA